MYLIHCNIYSIHGFSFALTLKHVVNGPTQKEWQTDILMHRAAVAAKNNKYKYFYLYISISLYFYISILLYLYIAISLYLYISISLYL